MYKFQHVIENLSKNKSIIIMRQDKGCWVTILDRKDWHRKVSECTRSEIVPQIKYGPN